MILIVLISPMTSTSTELFSLFSKAENLSRCICDVAICVAVIVFVYTFFRLQNYEYFLIRRKIFLSIRKRGLPLAWCPLVRNVFYSLSELFFHFLISLMKRAGAPATTASGGTSLVTMLPAATMALSPMVTPARTVTLAPNHAFCPMTMGFVSSW